MNHPSSYSMEDTELFLSNHNLKRAEEFELSNDDAQYLSDKTLEEDKLEDKAPDQIQMNAKNGCFTMRDENNIIVACIFLRKYNTGFHDSDIFERGLLWVRKDLRKHGLGGYMRFLLNSNNTGKPIVSITSNPAIMAKNLRAGEMEYNQKDLQDKQSELFNILLEDDLDEKFGYKYYFNSFFQKLLG